MIICNRKHFPRNPDSQIFCLYSLKWTMCVSFSALEGDWLVYYFGHQRFLISNTSVLTRYMSAGLSFRTKRKLLSSLRYPFPWKLAATALQIRISLRFCDCGSLCNNAVLHLFFLLGTLNEKSMEKHGWCFPPFFIIFLDRYTLWANIEPQLCDWFFYSVFLIWILVNQVAHKILENNFVCACLIRFSGWAIHPGYPWA